MTDRELLEAAAKAAGIDFRLHTEAGIWNPLQHDGDALRLAVALRINVYNPPENGASASCSHTAGIVCYFNEDGETPAAVRRAIVRAAASISL